MNSHGLSSSRPWTLPLTLLAWSLLTALLPAAPAQYYMDERGHELLILQDDEIPIGGLRVVSPTETLLVSGDLEEQDGTLSFQMSAGMDPEETEAPRAGWKVRATLDPDKTRAQVTLETFGKSLTDRPLLLIPANGTYKRVTAAERLQLAKAEHQQAEALLATARERVASVDHPGLKELLKDQGLWEDERLETARFTAETVDDQQAPDQVPDYWQTMAEMSRMRALLLVAASGLDAPKTISGLYADDAGGAIELAADESTPPKTLRFDITVIRGETAHTGAISGVAEFRSPTEAVFVDTDKEAFSGDMPATLRFHFKGHELVIEAENTSFYHGARAYFDGTYYHLPARP